MYPAWAIPGGRGRDGRGGEWECSQAGVRDPGKTFYK